MRSLIFALAVLAVGCSSADSTAVASTGSTGTTGSTSTGSDTAAPTSTGTNSTTTPAAGQAGSVSASDLVNPDGKIDPGLPKTAAPGAKLPKDGDPIAILTTNQGKIVVKFFPQKAPHHVENFISLAKKNFYNETKFHRVIKGFMIQGGDPNTKTDVVSSWGQGNPGYTVKAEFNDIPHTPGILSMARSQDPDSAGSQFFIVHGTSSFLDGKYTVFGQVIEGMDVVDKIATTPTGEANRPVKPMILEKVEITKWPVKLD